VPVDEAAEVQAVSKPRQATTPRDLQILTGIIAATWSPVSSKVSRLGRDPARAVLIFPPVFTEWRIRGLSDLPEDGGEGVKMPDPMRGLPRYDRHLEGVREAQVSSKGQKRRVGRKG